MSKRNAERNAKGAASAKTLTVGRKAAPRAGNKGSDASSPKGKTAEAAPKGKAASKSKLTGKKM
ncbi:MAG TPA: hypothetical protein VK454_04570, partial [Myxococcaceae bacterium]|nr:hypothetical protein [Myxococcaceae bacterium]